MKKTVSILLILGLLLCAMPLASYAEASPFEDVGKEHWAKDYIIRAYEDEVIAGTYYDPETGVVYYGDRAIG